MKIELRKVDNKKVAGCCHSSVDLSAPSILLPRVRLPGTPSLLLSFTVKFVLYLSLQCVGRRKIKKKRPGLAHFFYKKVDNKKNTYQREAIEIEKN